MRDKINMVSNDSAAMSYAIQKPMRQNFDSEKAVRALTENKT